MHRDEAPQPGTEEEEGRDGHESRLRAPRTRQPDLPFGLHEPAEEVSERETSKAGKAGHLAETERAGVCFIVLRRAHATGSA
jgi:hypothetical protein